MRHVLTLIIAAVGVCATPPASAQVTEKESPPHIVSGVLTLARASCSLMAHSKEIPLRCRLLQKESRAALVFPSGLLLEGSRSNRRIDVSGTYLRGDGLSETYRVRSGRLRLGFVPFRVRVYGKSFTGETCRAAYQGRLLVRRAA